MILFDPKEFRFGPVAISAARLGGDTPRALGTMRATQQHRHLRATGLPLAAIPFRLDFWWKPYMTAAFLLLKEG